MFQDPSLFLFLFRDAAEAVTKRIIQTCAEFKACIWVDKEIYMTQEERTIPPAWMCFYPHNWFYAIIIMQMKWNQPNIVSVEHNTIK